MIKKYSTFIKESKLHEDIYDICREYDIRNYHINEDGTVDVEGDVHFSDRLIEKLPLSFGTVTGNFSVPQNELITLKGSPHTVGGGFRCQYNNLTTLEGAPHTVGGDYSCHRNKITSLKGVPSTINGHFYCNNNSLTNLNGCPSIIKGHFNCSYNQLTTMVGGPSEVGEDYDCSDNKLSDFSGFPNILYSTFLIDNNKITSFDGFPEIRANNIEFNASYNPVHEILKLFSIGQYVKAIYLINEWEVIDRANMEVSYLRLTEVFEEFGRHLPGRDDVSYCLKHYKFVD